jgi:hypothetical protein
LDVDQLLKLAKIRKLFKPIVLSAKDFENLLKPADAPAQNPFQRFAEDRALNEFLSFLQRIECTTVLFDSGLLISLTPFNHHVISSHYVVAERIDGDG